MNSDVNIDYFGMHYHFRTLEDNRVITQGTVKMTCDPSWYTDYTVCNKRSWASTEALYHS